MLRYPAGVSIDKRVMEDVVPEELGEVAYHLIMHDVLPFARTAGIEDTKLNQYRKQFSDKQISAGTQYLLRQLCAEMDNNRQKVASALKALGFFKVAKMVNSGTSNAS